MRKLVACLACRNDGTRLYGKPMQNLDVQGGVSVLKHIVDMLKRIKAIDSIVLGIALGPSNDIFVDFANKNNIPYILGSEDGVFDRLIHCCKLVGGTDIFRITTESPFTYFEKIDSAWQTHIKNTNDLTILDDLVPEGCHFEIITLAAFEFAKKHGEDRHKKEFCTLYFKENIEKFKFCRIPVKDEMKRIGDVRLTIDNPEDLVVCRAVYKALKKDAPLIKPKDIIEFLDKNNYLKLLVKKYIIDTGFWDGL